MSVVTGTKLGAYEITGAIGAGGMGEVYRARDAKLGRDVALKVLPEGIRARRRAHGAFPTRSEGPRFAQSSQHCRDLWSRGFRQHARARDGIGGRADARGADQPGPIPVDEALKIAKQISEALEYAHERGIVHRDLKPANVKVTSDDAVKVLDFGLAKALDNDASSIDISSSPTLSRMATMQGVLLGTAAYMSPEQAKGKP